ncbi:hypothetical protein PoHVEF18_006779 [Penicillium ochrochloron]
MTNQFTMFETIRSWFQPAQEPVFENKWDANTVTMQQPNSPAGPAMNQAVSEQPESPESMAVVHMRGGGGGDICFVLDSAVVIAAVQMVLT